MTLTPSGGSKTMTEHGFLTDVEVDRELALKHLRNASNRLFSENSTYHSQERAACRVVSNQHTAAWHYPRCTA